MRIQSLTLENFQGIRSATFDFNCRSVSIYGDNATGKTTVFNAVTWLLFDRPSTGARGFTPKTRGGAAPDGYLHHLDHAAEAVVVTDGGRLVRLRKVYHENYRKKRGASAEAFDGHSVDFFLDGVPAKEKEYIAALENLCGGAERMKLLTMPEYFAETLSWEERRKLLLDLCGDVTDEQIISGNAELSELPSVLLIPGTSDRFYSVEAFQKIAASRKAEINRELNGIPGRIDEARRVIPDMTGIVPQTVEDKIAALEAEIARLTEERASANTGSTAGTETRRAIAELRTQISEGRARHSELQTDRNAETNAAIEKAESELTQLRQGRINVETSLTLARAKLDSLEKRRGELVRNYQSVAAEQWDPNSEVCPTCGQPFPPEKVGQMRSDFNLKRSRTLEEINAQGKSEASKEMIATCQATVAEGERLSREADDAIAETEVRIRDLRARLIPAVPYETTSEYKALTAQISSFEKRLAAPEEAVRNAVAIIDEKLRTTRAALASEQDKRSAVTLEKAQKERIAQLEARERELGGQYETLEHGLYLCDQFTKAKVRMLTERVNGKFHSVRFRLFVEQVNGGLKSDCEVLVPGEGGAMVPYRDANHAARINAGLEIIAALSAHWEMSMPVFIDNAESVTRLARTRTQTVRLVVSERDPALRLELEPAPESIAA